MATGSVILDFGTGIGTDLASATVTGQTGITASSNVGAWVSAEDTVRGTKDEAILACLNVCCGVPTADTGFTIYATCPHGRISGTFKIIWAWA